MLDDYDPRLTAARPDLAAKYLEGKVKAARFVEGTVREVRDAQAVVEQRELGEHRDRRGGAAGPGPQRRHRHAALGLAQAAIDRLGDAGQPGGELGAIEVRSLGHGAGSSAWASMREQNARSGAVAQRHAAAGARLFRRNRRAPRAMSIHRGLPTDPLGGISRQSREIFTTGDRASRRAGDVTR